MSISELVQLHPPHGAADPVGVQAIFCVPDLLTRHRDAETLEKVAIVDGGRTFTYEQLLEQSFRYGAVLKEAGVRKGDRIGIFLRRSMEAVAALFATWLNGGVAVLINDQLRPRQVRHILDHSEARFLISEDALSQHLPEIPGSVTRIDLNQPSPFSGGFARETVLGADLALIIYTSGSTGLPKGVMVSHENLLSGVRIVSDYLSLTSSDVIISLLPFNFDYGLNQVLTALAVGGTLVIQRSLFPPDICTTLRRERVTGLAGVPMLWLQLTSRHSPFLKWTFPDLRYLTNTGGKVPEKTVRSVRAAHPNAELYLMYGLTEAFRSTYLPPGEVDQRPTSMGKAIPNVEILVINDQNRVCGPGEVGELIHRGANISLGYWRDPQTTSLRFRPHPLQKFGNGREEIVVFSGDLVKTDEEGFLYYVGRKDQLIKSHGFRVSPEEIETTLVASKLVAGAVAFAIGDDGVESGIGVAIIPSDTANYREEALEEFCAAEMPEYMRPRSVWRMDEFPLTTTGKADRQRIREMCSQTT